ncbi:MAG: GntR family transcriptional regulator [Alphaproteobacteria bacterium]
MAEIEGTMGLESDIQPIDRQVSLGEQAYDRLRQSIVRGRFEPGVKMTVRSVAEALGISTTPARDAINRLIADGVLVNKGPRTVVVPEMTMESLDEITKIRLVVEGLAADEAARNCVGADVEFLETTQSQLNTALDEERFIEVLEMNKAFHFRIYECANMPSLLSFIESLWVRIGPSFHQLYPEFAISKRGVANHQWAIRGMQDRDGETVKAAIQNDIRDGYKQLSRMIGAEIRARQ